MKLAGLLICQIYAYMTINTCANTSILTSANVSKSHCMINLNTLRP